MSYIKHLRSKFWQGKKDEIPDPIPASLGLALKNYGDITDKKIKKPGPDNTFLVLPTLYEHNVKARTIQNSNVEVGGNLEADSVSASDVVVKGMITLNNQPLSFPPAEQKIPPAITDSHNTRYEEGKLVDGELVTTSNYSIHAVGPVIIKAGVLSGNQKMEFNFNYENHRITAQSIITGHTSREAFATGKIHSDCFIALGKEVDEGPQIEMEAPQIFRGVDVDNVNIELKPAVEQGGVLMTVKEPDKTQHNYAAARLEYALKHMNKGIFCQFPPVMNFDRLTGLALLPNNQDGNRQFYVQLQPEIALKHFKELLQHEGFKIAGLEHTAKLEAPGPEVLQAWAHI